MKTYSGTDYLFPESDEDAEYCRKNSYRPMPGVNFGWWKREGAP
jgi:hypothetical protein